MSSRTTHTVACDLCPRKTTTTGGTPDDLRVKAIQRGWETRFNPQPGQPDLDLCPACAKQHPRETTREVQIGKGRPRRRRPFGRQDGGWAPPGGPLTFPPPSGPKTT